MNKDTVLKADMIEILDMLKADKKKAEDRLQELVQDGIHEEEQNNLSGYIEGIDWCITNLEINL